MNRKPDSTTLSESERLGIYRRFIGRLYETQDREASYRLVAEQFGVDESTVRLIVWRKEIEK